MVMMKRRLKSKSANVDSSPQNTAISPIQESVSNLSLGDPPKTPKISKEQWDDREAGALHGWFRLEMTELRNCLTAMDAKLETLLDNRGVHRSSAPGRQGSGGDAGASVPDRAFRIGIGGLRSPSKPMPAWAVPPSPHESPRGAAHGLPPIEDALLDRRHDDLVGGSTGTDHDIPTTSDGIHSLGARSSGMQSNMPPSLESSRGSSHRYPSTAFARSKTWGSMTSDMADTIKVLDKIKRGNRNRAQEAVWVFLEEPSRGSWSEMYVKLMALVVMASVLITLIESIDFRSQLSQGAVGTALQFAFDSFYTSEILVRFLVCPSWHLFFMNAHNIIDFVAGLLPLILRVVAEAAHGPVMGDGGRDDPLRLILFCCVPVLRTLKLLRHFEQFHLLLRAFRVACEALPVLLFTQTIMVLFFAALIYAFEPRTNIPTFSTSLWMTIVTMMTVGYGDTVPVSTTGHIIVSVLIICSTLYMAMPLGIVGDAFSQVWADRDRLMLVKLTRDKFWQCGYTANDVPKLFNLFDRTKSGELSLNEFTRMLLMLRLSLSKERILQLFQSLDTDGSGSIDDEEFVRCIFPAQYVQIYGNS